MAGYRTDVRLQARSVRATATYKAMRWRMKWRLSAGYAQIGKESTMKPAKKVTQKFDTAVTALLRPNAASALVRKSSGTLHTYLSGTWYRHSCLQ